MFGVCRVGSGVLTLVIGRVGCWVGCQRMDLCRDCSAAYLSITSAASERYVNYSELHCDKFKAGRLHRARNIAGESVLNTWRCSARLKTSTNYAWSSTANRDRYASAGVTLTLTFDLSTSKCNHFLFVLVNYI